ncbi:UNVERIFIED_ORG: hypothetical protein J2Y81_002285 [Paraburkholderia sediminicola]|nr:hypothetical protein [Paraburkholderia sediminicola]
MPGIDAAKYLTVFKKLKWDELALYPDVRIFYAAIRWSKPLDTDDVTLFRVTDHRLICCLVDEITYPTLSK